VQLGGYSWMGSWEAVTKKTFKVLTTQVLTTQMLGFAHIRFHSRYMGMRQRCRPLYYGFRKRPVVDFSISRVFVSEWTCLSATQGQAEASAFTYIHFMWINQWQPCIHVLIELRWRRAPRTHRFVVWARCECDNWTTIHLIALRQPWPFHREWRSVVKLHVSILHPQFNSVPHQYIHSCAGLKKP
jgi:hypothetical protein